MSSLAQVLGVCAWGWCLGVVGIWLPVLIFGAGVLCGGVICGGVLGENLLLIEKPIHQQLPGGVVAEAAVGAGCDTCDEPMEPG